MIAQRVTTVLFSLSACALFGCAKGGLNSSEKMMWSTYAFGTKSALATCFVVARKDPSAPGGVLPIIVTTGHMLATAPRGPFYLGARIVDADGRLDVALVEFQPPAGAPLLYAQHPRCDIVALELHIPPQFAPMLTIPSFVRQDGIESRVPSPGEDVSITGFPRVQPGTRAGFPVLRSGRIASYLATPENEPQRFLINTDVYHGDSGAPVFVAAGKRSRVSLVGMIVEHVGKDPKSTVPLAIAVDGKSIRETLTLLEQKHYGRSTRQPSPKVAGQKSANDWRVTVRRNRADDFAAAQSTATKRALPLRKDR